MSHVCIADRVLLYIRHGMSELARDPEFWNDEEKIMTAHTERLYRYIRSDPDILNGKNPRNVAAAIVYLSGVLAGAYITQAHIAKAFNTSIAAVRTHSRRLRLITSIDDSYLEFCRANPVDIDV